MAAATATKPATATALPSESDTKPVQWAAPLVKALEKSGTGNAALDVIRAEMIRRNFDPEHKNKAASHPDRHVTAKEAVAILERELPNHVTTIDKARQFAETGTYLEPAPVKPASDLLPEPPETDAPERELPVAEAKELRQIAGVVGKTPGVHNVNADINTIGPKRIAGKTKLGS
jgi:hypothetical protein